MPFAVSNGLKFRYIYTRIVILEWAQEEELDTDKMYLMAIDI